MQQFYLAPMEGITTYIFRNAIAKFYGGLDRYYTPFLTASHLKGRELRDVTPENNKGIDIVPQILTNDAELFLVITKQLSELGYREVNLNLGCPSGTVVSKGRGAGFLDCPDKLDVFLDEIFVGAEKLAVNISIKTRIGMEFLSEWEDILKVYINYPIKELIIHPRLRNEFYNGEVHVDAFLRAQEIDAQTTLCYNGDIVDITSYQNIMNKIQSQEEINVMIGRGLLMNPNLANELNIYNDGLHNSYNESNPGFIKSSEDKKKFKSFLEEITENYKEEMANDKQVVMKMKELWTYLGKGLGLDNKQLKEIYKTNRFADYRNVVQMIMMSI